MRHFFVLILLLITSALKAQVSYQLLSETEGFPTKEIYQVYIDSKGYLWIGHAMGISRYNGNRFTHYNNPQQNSLGISNIIEDAKGRIWCRNFGAQIFYIENNQMHLLEAYDWKTQFNFPCIALDDNGNLLANHRNGVFVYNIEHKTAEIIKPDNTPIGFQINTIAKLTPDNKVHLKQAV
ncbi:MAG: hypothetical protein KF781_05235 [Chitinophagaceae bacterium]|nr:hypothetical protein [Chitinophagaceae bacterium]MCW5905921.1 hypothetical protein [Chitinophagaceae bacterium]